MVDGLGYSSPHRCHRTGDPGAMMREDHLTSCHEKPLTVAFSTWLKAATDSRTSYSGAKDDKPGNLQRMVGFRGKLIEPHGGLSIVTVDLWRVISYLSNSVQRF